MKYHIDDSEECATEHIKKIVLGTGKHTMSIMTRILLRL